MCGIAGQLRFDGAAADVAVGRRMGELLKHRGPDDQDVYASGPCVLAHRRLSIIDLSAAGRQPMASADGRYHIVYNGEIYNYVELRQQLIQRGHVFRTHTDTEVILHLYHERGADCLGELNGMFAIAIWDATDGSLFLARDRLGIKPLYVTRAPSHVSFASEIKALFADATRRASIDYAGLAEYLTLQFCLGSRTLFSDVEKLLPGEWMRVAADGTTNRKIYWDVDYTVDPHHTDEYFADRLRALLEDAVRIQLRADVPVGAHLSGGLDSSLVTTLAANHLGGKLHAFTGAFADGPRYDERQHARLVAERVGATMHEVTPTARDFVRVMPQLMWHLDEPVAGPGLFPQYFVSKLASENVKVVLGGQGGDEIFAGYTRYLVAYLEECIRGGIAGTQNEDGRFVVTFESILPNLTQLQGYEPMLRQFWKSGLFDEPDARYFRLVDRSESLRQVLAPELSECVAKHDVFAAYRETFHAGHLESHVNRMTRFDLKTLLPALLQVEDRTSMAVSLESRVPLLDHRIVELVASMPPRVKYAGGRSKHILREVARDIVPREILDRRDKMGFPVPLSDWLRKGPVREFVFDTLLDDRARGRGFFDTKGLEAMLNHESDFARNVWGVLCLELWMRAFIDA